MIFVNISLATAKERLLRRGREGETEEVIARRFEFYQNESQPVLDFYRKKGKLIEVRGEGKPGKVATEINRRMGLES